MAILRKILACLLVASCAAALDVESEKLVQHYQQQYLQHYEAHVRSLNLKSDEPVDEKEPKCPPKESVEPCTCTIYQKTLNILCNGTSVTQDSIDNAVALVRQANNLQSYDKLSLASFALTLSEIQTLDLTTFQNSDVTFFMTILNNNLSKIVGAGGLRSDQPAGLVNSSYLMIIGSQQLDNAGFDNTLSLFEPTMAFLALAVTGIEGGQFPVADGSGDVEFLPYLSSLSTLKFLALGGNPIKYVGGGQFKRNSQLISLSLGGKITELGADAFIFKENKADSLLILDLSFNPLTDSSFQSVQVNGLASGQRPIHLSVPFTKLTTLSEQNFAPFIRANDKNRINVQYNRLECDRNMRWLRQNRKYYESRVLNARCANDNNRSVFESKKTQ